MRSPAATGGSESQIHWDRREEKTCSKGGCINWKFRLAAVCFRASKPALDSYRFWHFSGQPSLDVGWDFIFDTTEEGKTIKILSIVDESSRFCIDLNVNRKIDGRVILQALDAACERYRASRYIRSLQRP